MTPSINRQFNNFSHTLKPKPNRNVTNPRHPHTLDNSTIPPTPDPHDLIATSNSTQSPPHGSHDNEIVPSTCPHTPVRASSTTQSGQVDLTTPNPTLRTYSSDHTVHNVSPNIHSRINLLVQSYKPPISSNEPDTVSISRSLRPRNLNLRYTQ